MPRGIWDPSETSSSLLMVSFASCARVDASLGVRQVYFRKPINAGDLSDEVKSQLLRTVDRCAFLSEPGRVGTDLQIICLWVIGQWWSSTLFSEALKM